MFVFACDAIDAIFMFNLIFDLVSTLQEKQSFCLTRLPQIERILISRLKTQSRLIPECFNFIFCDHQGMFSS